MLWGYLQDAARMRNVVVVVVAVVIVIVTNVPHRICYRAAQHPLEDDTRMQIYSHNQQGIVQFFLFFRNLHPNSNRRFHPSH